MLDVSRLLVSSLPLYDWLGHWIFYSAWSHSTTLCASRHLCFRQWALVCLCSSYSQKAVRLKSHTSSNSNSDITSPRNNAYCSIRCCISSTVIYWHIISFSAIIINAGIIAVTHGIGEREKWPSAPKRSWGNIRYPDNVLKRTPWKTVVKKHNSQNPCIISIALSPEMAFSPSRWISRLSRRSFHSNYVPEIPALVACSYKPAKLGPAPEERSTTCPACMGTTCDTCQPSLNRAVSSSEHGSTLESSLDEPLSVGDSVGIVITLVSGMFLLKTHSGNPLCGWLLIDSIWFCQTLSGFLSSINRH